MKQIQLYLSALCISGLVLISACTQSDGNGSSESKKSNEHTYHIEIAGGKTFQGSVPKTAPGVSEVYNPISFVEYSEEIESKILTGLLMDTGKFQFGIGVALDDSNNPTIQGSGPGLTFGEWGVEDKYGPVGNISMTLENYKEHTVSLYGEEGTVASYTFTFSGTFKLGADGEEVNVVGEIVAAAP